MNAKLKTATRDLMHAVLDGAELTLEARVEFGIETPFHFMALSLGVMAGTITAELLDAALGNGALITQLVRDDPTNPFHSLSFRTRWDIVMGREAVHLPSSLNLVTTDSPS